MKRINFPLDLAFLLGYPFVLLAVFTVVIPLSSLSLGPWTFLAFAAFAVSLVGVGLLFRAKLPLYRQHRFFEFGSQSLPASSVPYYRAAYRLLIPSIVLLFLLVLSSALWRHV